jgi:hypothetical protein
MTWERATAAGLTWPLPDDPPLMSRAFGAHCQERTLPILDYWKSFRYPSHAKPFNEFGAVLRLSNWENLH